MGSHQFLPKLKRMGCAGEVTGVLDNPSSGKRLFEARKAESQAPSAGSTGSPSLGWVSPVLSAHLVFLYVPESAQELLLGGIGGDGDSGASQIEKIATGTCVFPSAATDQKESEV